MTLVYRYYDQAELERQLNARGTVPDVSPFLARYAAESARMRASLPCRLGVPYGPTEPERLDIFPATKPEAPVFVFLHGGYWRALDSADSCFMAECFTKAGACVVAVNYALAPNARLTEIVRQCHAALIWLHRNIAEFGGDPRRIHVAGSSAGAQLAAMMLPNGSRGEPGSFITGATLLSGLYDLQPVRLGHPNEWLKLDAAEVKALSPIRHLPAQRLPIVFSYAPSETGEFKRQSECYLALAEARGCPVRFVPMPDTNHFDIVFGLADPASPLAQAVMETMGL
jgi:arylformamidase